MYMLHEDFANVKIPYLNSKSILPEPGMNIPSLPTEVLELVIEEFISEYADTTPVRSMPSKFFPHWYLTPLLRVCRMWHKIDEKYMYRSVAIGSKIPYRNSATEGESLNDRMARLSTILEAQEKRNGHEIAEDLLATMTTNSRLASMIKALQLGIEVVDNCEDPEWTQTNTSILRIFPNVNQVDIRGFDPSELDSLLSVLKEKSLASFFISPVNLSALRVKGGTSSQLFGAMQNWSKRRIIEAGNYLESVNREDLAAFDASQATNCCPELREIIFTGAVLRENDLKALRSMCSGVARLNVPLYGRRAGSTEGEAALDALCGCLRAWSSTLECLKLSMRSTLFSYGPLSKVFSALRGLRELQLVNMKLDIDVISDLPGLERLLCAAFLKKEELNNLSIALEDTKKFPSLKCVVVRLGHRVVLDEYLENMCFIRRIKLQIWGGRISELGFLL